MIERERERELAASLKSNRQREERLRVVTLMCVVRIAKDRGPEGDGLGCYASFAQ
jgi:hypothetical protein